MYKPMISFFTSIGAKVFSSIGYIGSMALLLGESFLWIFVPPYKISRTIQQIYKIGFSSLGLVFMTALFTGMVLALQSAYSIKNVSDSMDFVATLVALSMSRELGPVLTALVIAGRVGASMAAEIGSMKVTEQIDALKTLATEPVKYLVVPRLVAIVIALPLLTLYADIIGMVGGCIIATGKLGVSYSIYHTITFETLEYKDVYTGLIKAFVFAIIICITACYEGFRTEEGSEGVGRSTTKAVVVSFILIIAADCLLTALFYFAS